MFARSVVDYSLEIGEGANEPLIPVVAGEMGDEIQQGHYGLQGAGDVGPGGGVEHFADELLFLVRHDAEGV